MSPATDPEAALVGSYASFGDYSYNPIASPQFPLPFLGKVLAGIPFNEADAPGTVVKITHPKPGTLVIEVLTGEGKSRTRVLEAAQDDFRVADGAVWLRTVTRRYGDGTGYVRERDSLGFRKTRDGALVCEWRHGSAALAMWVVPLTGSQVYWMRWAQVPATAR